MYSCKFISHSHLTLGLACTSLHISTTTLQNENSFLCLLAFVMSVIGTYILFC